MIAAAVAYGLGAVYGEKDAAGALLVRFGSVLGDRFRFADTDTVLKSICSCALCARPAKKVRVDFGMPFWYYVYTSFSALDKRPIRGRKK